MSKEGLRVGQRFASNPGVTLYVNDNYQFGVWVEEEFNDGTTHMGQPVSGTMDSTQPVEIISLLEEHPEMIDLRVTKVGGFRPGRCEASIKLDLFQRYFAAA